MRSTILPLCSRVVCRAVAASVVLLVMLGGLRLLSAAETRDRDPRTAARAVAAAPRPVTAVLVEAPGAWAPTAVDVELAVRYAGVTCGGTGCGFDRVEALLAPTWRAAEAPPRRRPGSSWVPDATRSGESPLLEGALGFAWLVQPESLDVAF